MIQMIRIDSTIDLHHIDVIMMMGIIADVAIVWNIFTDH